MVASFVPTNAVRVGKPCGTHNVATRRPQRHPPLQHRFRRCVCARVASNDGSDNLDTVSLPKCVGYVRGAEQEVFVIGTAHTGEDRRQKVKMTCQPASSRSAEEARSVIESLKPDVVVLELDQERFDNMLLARQTLRRGSTDSNFSPTQFSAPGMLEWAVRVFYGWSAALGGGSAVGAEFLAAAEAAER
eukprot:2294381-Pyramimonas_sp.AAC.2